MAFDWTPPVDGAFEADASAYALTGSGRVRSDADMVFYNQPSGCGGALRFDPAPGGRSRFFVDPAGLPTAVERIVFCVTVHPGQSRRPTLADLPDAGIEVAGADGGEPIRYRPDLGAATEAALIMGELYLRAGSWKFRAVGQGFAGGLAPLARSFGIDVAEDAPPPPPPPPPHPPSQTTVRLGKVSLEKPGQTVSLEKRGAAFGEIVVNLNWSRGRRSVFGGGEVDLDLGCLFELSDGRKGVVQALGEVFGSFAQAPFVELSGDDRTGDAAKGETLRINGAHWGAIRRLAVFANIYGGVPNWQRTDGVVTVTVPGEAPIEVRMTEGRNDRRLCGIVLIANDGGRLKATRIVEYVRDQQVLDERLGWGLRWTTGRKR